MMIELENSEISIKVKHLGAELSSIQRKDTSLEYLWQADERIWGRHAPILFPIVGKLKDQKYISDNKEYTLPQHGFARDMKFELKEKDHSYALFELESNETSVKNYPFKFKLQVIYKLEGNSVIISNKVENLGQKIMPFSIGAHPGFNCPLLPNENYEDYYLEFEKPQKLVNHGIKEGLVSGETEDLGNQVKKIQLTKHLFDNDALVFKNLSSTRLTLKSTKNPHSVEVDFPNFPYLGIWTKPGTYSFICIEPWYGVADSIDADGNILKKEGIQLLEPGESFTCDYNIKVK